MAEFEEKYWDQCEEVQEYLNTEFPTVDQYADAYFIRDTRGFNYSFDVVKTTALQKLFHTEESILINKVHYLLNVDVRKYISNLRTELSTTSIDEYCDNTHLLNYNCQININTIKTKYFKYILII